MAFPLWASAKQLDPFNGFEIGEFFRWNDDIYVKSDIDRAINLSQDGRSDHFDFTEQVEDIQVEIKIL